MRATTRAQRLGLMPEGLPARVGALAVRARLGRASTEAEREALGAQVLAAALGAVLCASALPTARIPAGIVAGAFAGWRAGEQIPRAAARGDVAAERGRFPDLLDRIIVCVASGMSVDGALRTVATESDATTTALRAGLASIDAGVPRAEAYRRIASRAPLGEVGELLAVVERAERYGTPVETSLRAFASDLRSRERARAEAEARTAPVKLIFPLVFCFLPAFVLLTIAPIALSAVRTLGGL